MNKNKIICIHGYGKRRGRQFDDLSNAFKGDEFICPDYYDLSKEDGDYKLWIKRIDALLNKYKEEEIVLIGFSLGALIASRFVKEYGVKKLILISPALDCDRFIKIKKENIDPLIPYAYLDEVKKCVDECLVYFRALTIPVSILHSKADELIPYQAVLREYEQLSSPKKKLFLFEKGHHTLLDDSKKKEEIIKIIRNELI